nr:alcohol dehydrogenase catalytic domain-containing protein [Klebsiella pneumoniae]
MRNGGIFWGSRLPPPIGTYSASQPLESMAITRRDPGPQDVQIAIAYCGVCHSDLHQARSEWAGTLYP